MILTTMHYKTILAAALAVNAATADSTSMNLTSLIASNSNLSALGTLLKAYPSIASSLANATNVTVLAPDNAAISALNTSMSSMSSSVNMTKYIEALLDYHVIPGKYFASNFSSTPLFPHTMLNMTMYSNVTDGQVVECVLSGKQAEIISGMKMVSNVTQANLNYSGGVVHVIDKVLTIPDNFSTTAQAADLTDCVGATNALNLTSTLDTAMDITIFAPSNSAFQEIATGLTKLNTSQLTDILEYHVMNGTVDYSTDLKNGSLMMMDGKNLTVRIENGTIFVNAARIINADILIANGVIHVIDSVLNPNNTAGPNPTMTGVATAFSGASSGTVPFTSGVTSPTSTNSALVTTNSAVAVSYSTTNSGFVGASSVVKSSSSKAAAAAMAMPTGAIGAAALFGGAAFLANNA